MEQFIDSQIIDYISHEIKKNNTRIVVKQKKEEQFTKIGKNITKIGKTINGGRQYTVKSVDTIHPDSGEMEPEFIQRMSEQVSEKTGLSKEQVATLLGLAGYLYTKVKPAYDLAVAGYSAPGLTIETVGTGLVETYVPAILQRTLANVAAYEATALAGPLGLPVLQVGQSITTGLFGAAFLPVAAIMLLTYAIVKNT